MSSRANRIAQNSMELCTEHQTRVIRELFGKINCLFLFPQKGGGGNTAKETQRQIQDNQGIFFLSGMIRFHHRLLIYKLQ